MNFKMLIVVFICVTLILGHTDAGTLSKVLQDGMERGLTLASRDDIATGRNDVLTNFLLLLDQISRRKGKMLVLHQSQLYSSKRKGK